MGKSAKTQVKLGSGCAGGQTSALAKLLTHVVTVRHMSIHYLINLDYSGGRMHHLVS